MKPLPGDASVGESFSPKELSDESEDAPAPKPAPRPGLPVSEAEYKRMKEAAKHTPGTRLKEAQEDRLRKEEKP